MKKVFIACVLAVVLTLIMAPAVVFAHGGSVDPPVPEGSVADEHVDCRDLALHERTRAPSDGLKTASVSGVVSWSHCPR